jgi:hypothetical protein
MLAIGSAHALGVLQVHDIDMCARAITMTTSTTAMAGRIRCIVHLIEITYEITIPGRKGDALSNANTLQNLLLSLAISMLSKSWQPPRPYATSRKDARLPSFEIRDHRASQSSCSYYCCCHGVFFFLRLPFSIHQ